ncbi:MAG: hypothetical protein QNJ54_35025 [Prochloraceae cyanobacterium]|nr:hypothetical protein [Prochloraceae cyanobacterium]
MKLALDSQTTQANPEKILLRIKQIYQKSRGKQQLKNKIAMIYLMLARRQRAAPEGSDL